MSKRALVSFRMDASEYCFVMPADDWADAEKRLTAICATAKVVGCPAYGIPANSLTLPFAHLFSAAFTWIRNAIR